MAATLLSYTSSKYQLKWLGTKESLLTFLTSWLQVESCDIQVKDNGTCSVMKAKGMTFNFYIKAKTLQIQGKENANQLRADLVNLACTENSNGSVSVSASFTVKRPLCRLHSMSRDGLSKDGRKMSPMYVTLKAGILRSQDQDFK